MASSQRSRNAILAGAKSVIAEVGAYESNMLDIAERAQVSRATVYNHFADKEEMISTLLETEVQKIIALAQSAPSRAEALFTVSRAISTDAALARMVQTDPEDVLKFVSVGPHPLWREIGAAITSIFGARHGSLVLRWFLGQVASPLSESESRLQADEIARLFG